MADLVSFGTGSDTENRMGQMGQAVGPRRAGGRSGDAGSDGWNQSPRMRRIAGCEQEKRRSAGTNGTSAVPGVAIFTEERIMASPPVRGEDGARSWTPSGI